MLILSRKREEKIMIGDDTSIMVVDIRGDQVQLGIDAPRIKPVHRYEIYQLVKDGVPFTGGRRTVRSHHGSEGSSGMLILSRKRDEKIMIGDDTLIVVVDIRGDQVSVGIEAPRSVPVHRHEIYEEIKAAQRLNQDSVGFGFSPPAN